MESYQHNEIFVKTLWVCSFMFGKQNKKRRWHLIRQLLHLSLYVMPVFLGLHVLQLIVYLSNRLTHACYLSYSDLTGYNDSKMSVITEQQNSWTSRKLYILYQMLQQTVIELSHLCNRMTIISSVHSYLLIVLYNYSSNKKNQAIKF